MSFTPYGSIELVTNQKFMNRVAVESRTESSEWIVLEKADGTHFSIDSEGRVAKRSRELEDGETYFVDAGFRESLRQCAVNIRNKLEVPYVRVDGELIGGYYTHPEFHTAEDAKKIQGAVQYCPEYAFYAYDISLKDGSYLDYNTCIPLFEEFGFFYAKPLFRGTLEECASHPIEFSSTIHRLFGLPPIEGNYAEGIVIKPVQDLRLRDGSRVIFKNKNARFSETYRPNEIKKNVVIPAVSYPAREIYKHMLCMVTPNRFRSVLSKEGPWNSDPKRSGRFKGLLARDVLSTYARENDVGLESLSKTEQQIIKKSVADECACVVDSWTERQYY